MNINDTKIGASTYAMNKAIEMPNLMLNLVQQIPNAESQSLNTENPAVKEAPDLSAITGKGKLINIIA